MNYRMLNPKTERKGKNVTSRYENERVGGIKGDTKEGKGRGATGKRDKGGEEQK